jgi:predicted transcriptional regulator
MKGGYRSRSRLVMDLLAALKAEGPVGVTRLLLIANMTHAKLQELLDSFEERGWVMKASCSERNLWSLTEKGERALGDLRRVDAVMQDHGLGL